MLTDVIHTVTVELECGDEESALTAQRGFQSHFSPVLQQLIDEEIATSGWAGRVLTIDKIEIDLGAITAEDLGSAYLFGRFRSAFADQLRRAAAKAVEPGRWQRVHAPRDNVADDAGAEEPSWSSVEAAQLAMLQEFLLTGLLPWWADMAAAPDAGRLFASVLEHNATALLLFLRRYRFNAAVVQRLCDVGKPETLQWVAQRIWGISYTETSPDLPDGGFPTQQRHLPPEKPSDPLPRAMENIPADIERLLQRMFEMTNRPGGSSTPGSSRGLERSPASDGEMAPQSSASEPAYRQLLRMLALLASWEQHMGGGAWTAGLPAGSGSAALPDDRAHSRLDTADLSGGSPGASGGSSDASGGTPGASDGSSDASGGTPGASDGSSDASGLAPSPPPAGDSGQTEIATRFSGEAPKPSPLPRPAGTPTIPPAHAPAGRTGTPNDRAVAATAVTSDANPIDAILHFLGVDRALSKLSWVKRHRLNQLIQRENIQGKEDERLLRGLLFKLNAEQKDRLAFLAGLTTAEMRQLIDTVRQQQTSADTQQLAGSHQPSGPHQPPGPQQPPGTDGQKPEDTGMRGPTGADMHRLIGADLQRLTGSASARQEPPPRDRLFILNAGLCLLSAYLPTLFKRLGYVHEGAFLHPDAQSRAIHLLQWLVTGMAPAGEYQLAFNKLLCGWPLDMPPARIKTLKKLEKKEGEGLLESVIQHWPALKKTSAAGLRSSFLQREGLLSEDAGVWTLKVERKSYDLLLGTIGWSYQLLKHPWMKKHIRVEW